MVGLLLGCFLLRLSLLLCSFGVFAECLVGFVLGFYEHALLLGCLARCKSPLVTSRACLCCGDC
jgi:hypothetical protein